MATLELREIARMEELRVAGALREVGDETRPIGGGVMCRGVPGTWFNNAVGLGLSGPVTPGELDALVEYYTSKGIEPRIEVCPFADESLITGLAERGFVLRMFEMVFCRELDPGRPVTPVNQPPADLQLRRIDAANEAEIMEFATVTVSGFMPPGKAAPPEFLEQAAKMARHPRYFAASAWLEGRCVGAGGMGASEGSAGLFGLSVLPEYRRRGIQQALLAYRMNEAAKLGAKIATIGSKPGEATERNVRRMGFTLAYTKVHMVKPGEGLVAVMG